MGKDIEVRGGDEVGVGVGDGEVEDLLSALGRSGLDDFSKCTVRGACEVAEFKISRVDPPDRFDPDGMSGRGLRTRPCRPQTNGKIERFHRNLSDG